MTLVQLLEIPEDPEPQEYLAVLGLLPGTGAVMPSALRTPAGCPCSQTPGAWTGAAPLAEHTSGCGITQKHRQCVELP